jgi:hypothetical protein
MASAVPADRSAAFTPLQLWSLQKRQERSQSVERLELKRPEGRAPMASAVPVDRSAAFTPLQLRSFSKHHCFPGFCILFLL